MARFQCSGDGPGFTEPCAFTTDSKSAAMDHFEATAHAVDDTQANIEQESADCLLASGVGSDPMTTASTLQLACPTCGGEIEIEYDIHPDCRTEIVSLRTWCFCPISREQAYDLLMDYGARQAELATERAGER